MFTLQSRRIGMTVAIAAAISGSTAFAASVHDAHSCLVEVLTSEMLSAAPPFYHTVKARLLVTPSDRPPFETTVVRTIPWQAPPPRQGQRLSMSCEAVQADSGFRLF
jgi:hypothetical protein